MTQSPPTGRMIGKVQAVNSVTGITTQPSVPPEQDLGKDITHTSSRPILFCFVIASSFFLVNESVEITD